MKNQHQYLVFRVVFVTFVLKFLYTLTTQGGYRSLEKQLYGKDQNEYTHRRDGRR